MQEAGFDDATPLYAASGLLTYGATQGMLQAISVYLMHISHPHACPSKSRH